jgi:hypothetical protein
MSYDVRVWGRTADELNALFSTEDGWTRDSFGWVLSHPTWQINVGSVQAVELDDVPLGVVELVPGVSRMVELTLQPISAPKSARSFVLATARAIAERLAGVVEDPQEDAFLLPRGAKRYAKPGREERFSQLTLRWWYLDSRLGSQQRASELLALLATQVPEAVPRRYGLCEPPQSKTEVTGVEALAKFLSENVAGSAAYYPTRPVVGFSAVEHAVPHPRLGFRCNGFRLDVEADVLDQLGWELAVRRLWRTVSRHFQPFYGEVRVSSGHMWMGSASGSDMRTEVEPVRATFWRGIPIKPGLAFVLGPPYTKLWSPPNAVHDGELAFVEGERWAERKPLAIEVPGDLAQSHTPAWVIDAKFGGYSVNWCTGLPAVWPFSTSR